MDVGNLGAHIYIKKKDAPWHSKKKKKVTGALMAIVLVASHYDAPVRQSKETTPKVITT